MQSKVIIDTDIGDDIDDVFAIALAVLSKKMNIVGITTCFRNASKRAKIAKALLNTLDANIPVYAGESNPLKQPFLIADFDQFDYKNEFVMPYYFNDMENIEINKTNAVDFMLKTIEENPNEITIISIAPLTNLAKAYQKSPETFQKVKEIVFMGGQTETMFKEWNVRNDVEAAKIIYESDIPMKIVGLDVTSQTKLNHKQIEKIRQTNNNDFQKLFNRMLNAYLSFFSGKRLPVMHDPLTIGCLIDDFCKFKMCHVEVLETGDNRGSTIIDESAAGHTKQLAYQVNVKQFIDYMLTCIFE